MKSGMDASLSERNLIFKQMYIILFSLVLLLQSEALSGLSGDVAKLLQLIELIFNVDQTEEIIFASF